MTRTDSDIAYDQRLGQRIKLFREQCGLQQQQLADQLRLSASTIHDYELGITSVPVVHLARLSAALDTAPYLLMYDLPFADASDWQFHHQYRQLDRRRQHQIRHFVTCMASGLPLLDR